MVTFPGEKLAIKIIDTLEKGIGALARPWQMIREGKARAEVLGLQDQLDRGLRGPQVGAQAAPLVEIDAKGRNYVRFELGKYDYQDFKITIEDFVPQIEGNELYLNAGDDTGLWAVGYSILNLNEAEKEEGSPVIAEYLASNPARSGQIEIILYRPFVAGAERRISFKSHVYTQLKMYSKKEGEIMFKHSLEPITQIQIFVGKGNILSGIFRLYGMSGA